MKHSKLLISIISTALFISLVFNIVQFIRHSNEFHQAEEQFMVQVNCDIKDAYDLLKSFVEGENRSEIVLHGITMKLEGLHSLLSSNYYLPMYYINTLNFLNLGRFLYAEGWISGPIYNGTFPGIYSDGIVSDNEIAFLKVLLTHLEYLIDNACLEIRVFNETFTEFNKRWEHIPLDLLEE